MKKLVLVDAEGVRQSIKRAVRASRDQHLLHQLHCVLLVGLGRDCKEVGSWFGDSTRTVERWVGQYNRVGVEALGCPHPAGRPSRMSAETAQRVAFELRQPPSVCGFGSAHWDGGLLQRHLDMHYGITLSLRQCQRIFPRLGSPPARHHPW